MNDYVILLGKLGLSANETALGNAIALLSLAEILIADSQWLGLDAGSEAFPAPYGLFGCLRCVFTCASDLRAAAICVDKNCGGDWVERCIDMFPDQTSFEYVDCIANGRRNCFDQCLSEIAAGAGTCATCITKCGPRP